MKLIDGKALAEKINDQTVQEVLRLEGKHPNLAIILVGDNPDSEIYVNKKIATGKKVGIETHLYKCDADIGQDKILEMIDFLNKDPAIHAIMVQLPLPKNQGYEADEVIKRISPEKDLDRFHPDNIRRMLDDFGDDIILPPVFAVIFTMLSSINIDLKNKKAAIVSKSEIFGGNLAAVFKFKRALAEVIHPDDKDLIGKISEADILISIVGRPKFIKKEMVKDGAIIIDVGITRDMGSIHGDVDFDDVKDMAGYISPVPGGVGPMTVAITLRNALKLYQQNRK